MTGQSQSDSDSTVSDGGGEEGAPAASPSDTVTVPPEEASGSPAPTVAAQEPGAPLAVTGVRLEAPEGWQVTGVSSDSGSEVVSAVSEDGQLISLRSVRTEATVEESIAQARDADAEQAVDAPAIEVGEETLEGVETRLTTSGGDVVQLQYFVRRGESLVTIDVVTTGEQKDSVLEQLTSGLTWT